MSIETPPTPEWMKRNACQTMRAAIDRSTGKELQNCYIKSYMTPYDVLESLDVLSGDYRRTIDTIAHAYTAFVGQSGTVSPKYGEQRTGGASNIRAYWLELTIRLPKDDAHVLAFIASDMHEDTNIQSLKRVLSHTWRDVEEKICKAEQIYLDWRKKSDNVSGVGQDNCVQN